MLNVETSENCTLKGPRAGRCVDVGREPREPEISAPHILNDDNPDP